MPACEWALGRRGISGRRNIHSAINENFKLGATPQETGTTRKSLFVFLIALILAACATSESRLGEATVRNGRIVQIDSVSLDGDLQLGLGAVIGAVAGGVLGHQFGGGTGRDIATVLGAVGGGVAGDVVQNRYADRRPGQHMIVKLDNGVAVA